MKAILFLTALAATPAMAEGGFVVSSPERAGNARTEAVITAQTARIASLTQQIDDLALEIARRTACENIGRLYIPGHAQANAQGCVDPNDF
jgi:hypothetical protein